MRATQKKAHNARFVLKFLPRKYHNGDMVFSDGVVDFDSGSTHNRTKRESTIEQRSCVQFQLEMVF